MRESHLQALRAAMRVATVGGLVACGSEPRTSPAQPTGGHAGTTAANAGTYGSPTGDACAIPTSAAVATAPAPVPTFTEPRRSDGGTSPRECSQVIANAKAGNRGTTPVNGPELVSCCNAQMEAHQSAWEARMRGQKGNEESHDTFWYCCSVSGTKSVSLCSPWGPPMPRAYGDQHTPTRARSAETLDLRVLARAVAPSIDAAPHVRHLAVGTWRERMVNEHGSAIVFEGLADQLRDAGFAEADACAAFAAEERRHGVLCGAVVEALGAEAAAPGLPDRVMPEHADASTPREAVLRNVLSICCLHETVAVALIGAERLEMAEGPLRDLLTDIWADEIGHARFGWMLLASTVAQLDAEERAGLGRYLARALEHLEDHELAHLPVAPDLGADPAARALGLCSGSEGRALYHAVKDDVILPRLEAIGITPARACA